jgi:all-trans-retinol 13,14-reductase
LLTHEHFYFCSYLRFEEKGYEFDVGVHYTGGQLDAWGSPLRRLWASVSDGALAWSPCADTYDVCLNVATGTRVDVHKSHATNDQRFLAAFPGVPGAAAALASYKRACVLGRLAFGCVAGFCLLPPWCLRWAWPLVGPLWRRFGGRSVAEQMRSCGFGASAGLRGLAGALCYLYGDYGAPPAVAPWFLQAALDNHYAGGAFMPLGGSSSVAKTLVAAVTRRGGAVLVRAAVTEILLDESRGGKAVGVRCRGVELRAKVAVISTAGFRNTFGSSDLDDDATAVAAAKDAPAETSEAAPGGFSVVGRATWQPLVAGPAAAKQRALLQGGAAAGGAKKDTVGGSPAMVYLFVGLNQSDAELGLVGQNVWRLKDFDHDAAWEAYAAFDPTGSGSHGSSSPAREAAAWPTRVPPLEALPACFVGMASAKDADWPRRHPNRACVTILAPVPHAWFAAWRYGKGGGPQHRGAAYEAYKAQWRALLLRALFAHAPQCEGHVEVATVGTPLSHDFYLGTVRGEVYGLDATVARYGGLEAHLATHPGPCLHVPGLYQAGQDALCVGVPSALLSGFFAAARISPFAAGRALLEAVVS